MSKKIDKIKNNKNYLSGCYTKIRYSKQVQAHNGKVSMEIKYPDQLFEYYLCSYCKGYHIGHSKHANKLKGNSINE